MTNTRLQQARDFLYRDARLLESRLFAVQFEGAAPDGVVDALLGYRNPDGGFGHALEPDKRSPASQPLDVQFAFETLVEAGVAPEDVILGACDFLEAVSTSEGMVPLALPGIGGYPRAPHWSADPYPPDLNPTAALVALLYQLGVEHAWRDRATEGCFAALEGGSLGDAHAILCVLKFLQWVPDRSRAERLTPRVAAALPTAEWFRSDATDPGYGQPPTRFAPAPTSPWRSLFDDALFEAHLDRLDRDQQEDGGWSITWETPGAAALYEWRGIETLHALRVLTAYGRI